MTAAYVYRSDPIEGDREQPRRAEQPHVVVAACLNQVVTKDKLSDNALCLQLLDRILIHSHKLS